jgi:hypothetical protein
MKPDHALILLLLLVAFLAVITPVLHIIDRSAPVYQAESNPEDVLHNYLLAIHNQSFELAYSYLASDENKPELGKFKEIFQNHPIDASGVGIEVGSSRIYGDEAVVEITLVYLKGAFPGDFRREQQTALLELENGQWKISAGPYPYWSWEWFNPPVKPIAEPIPVQE